jgi:hypothetical protein
MPSAYTQVADLLKVIIDTEFAAEGFIAIKDDLHESLGRKRVDIGIAPVEDVLQPGNALVQETTVEVKFYDLWTNEISPNTIVDPTRITEYAERFRNALGAGARAFAGNNQLWYFDVQRVTYPRDPTGNKTRFVATIRAKGTNGGLIETL